jgi:hypothetical protein
VLGRKAAHVLKKPLVVLIQRLAQGRDEFLFTLTRSVELLAEFVHQRGHF